MPPHVGSRYSFTSASIDAGGSSFLTDREPYRYTAHPDNRVHTVVAGDSLFTLAGHYFAPLPRACGFWWALADFQPEPIHDPTLVLESGALIYVPSLRVLSDIILADPRGGRR